VKLHADIAPAPRRVPASRGSLVLVAGSGRSGTSLFTGILQRLGYLVPQPEVPADETNPRGFGESQWVVDFHTRLLRSAGIQISDARPAASGLAAQVTLDERVADELRAWLAGQLAHADAIVVKDPRLSWFLPLWRTCAQDIGTDPRCVTMLRHPGAVVDSKQRYYGASHGDVARAAGWVHQTLFTERATRDLPRAFVPYEDLLDDWTRIVARAGEALDLAAVRDAPAASLRAAHEFVDRGLSRSRVGWGDATLPDALRALADEVWTLVSQLARSGGAGDDGALRALDAARAAYLALYGEAEAIVQSSITAARTRPARAPAPAPAPAPVLWLARRVPTRYRHVVPLEWRVRIARSLRHAIS